MKDLSKLLLLASFLLHSCSSEEKGPTDPPGVTRNAAGEIIAVEDSDCEDLSDNLEPDVFSLGENEINSEYYEDAKEFLHSQTASFLEIKRIEDQETPHYGKRGIFTFKLFYEKIPLCNAYAKIYTTTNKMHLKGNIPSSDLGAPAFLGLPEEIRQKALEEKFETNEITLSEKKNLCYVVKDKKLLLVWKQKIKREGAPYEVLGKEDKIFSVEPLFFHATATAKIYAEKDTDNTDFSALQSYKLPGVSTGGTLCSERFRVVPEEGESIAYSEDLNFVFNPSIDLEEFEQVAMFAYAEKQADYIKSLVHTKRWYGPQVLISPDIQNEGLTNNVFYLPGDNSNPPKIQMPKGDYVSLFQVRLDNEAVQHEVGHHVFYRSVKSGSGEAGILHEAVADIFVMLRTKNACLGEHLCLNDSLCMNLSCLRTADNDWTLTSYLELSGKHKKSQLISGMIWDLAVKIGYDKVAAWLNYSIDLLPEQADFSDFITALYDSLDQLYKEEQPKTFATRCAYLMDAFEARGFSPLAELSGITCDS